MSNKKLLTSLLLALAVLLAQVGTVAAAPQVQGTTPITGTIKDIQVDQSTQTVLVTLLDGQSVRISLETAEGLKLVDSTTLEVDQTKFGTEVTIEASAVLPDQPTTEPEVHPISKLLAAFFFKGDAEMAQLIDSFHTGDNEANQVFGFGVIAQALWMSKNLNDGAADADLAGLILQAKKEGNYEELSQYFKEGTPLPANWGQFKKAIKEQKDIKEKQNLGTIVSEKKDQTSEDAATQLNQNNGKGKDNNPGKDKGNGKGKGNNKNKP